MTRCRSFIALMLLLSWAPFAGADSDQAWTQWRGPSGQGYSDDQRVPLSWSEKRNLLWKTPLPGKGNSTPIISGDRVFLTAASPKGEERYVLCISRNDGKILWQHVASKGVPPGKTHGWNGYASASCTTDGQRVYAFFGTPGLLCYDRDGNFLWKHSFGIFTSETGWGTAASPFLVGDLVIQNCDNDGPEALPAGTKSADAAPEALVALDKVKGTVRWQTPRNQGRGFSTPRLIKMPSGRTDLVLNGPKGVWGYDPHTGKELWYSPRRDSKDAAKFGEPMPVSTSNVLVAFSGRPGPFQEVRLGGAGDVSKKDLVWEFRRKGRDVASPIIWGDYVYAADNKAVLTCYDLKTGKIVYTQRLAPDAKVLGSPVAVRGKLLFLLDTGETVVVEPGPTFKSVGRNVLGENRSLDFAASPAIVAGRLFLRSQSYLYCIGDRQ